MQKTEATPAEIAQVTQHLRVHKRVKESSGEHAIADCPACSKPKHLYANLETGMWDCKKCGQAGNLWTLASLLGVRVRQKRLVQSAAAVLMAGFQAHENAKMTRRVRDVKGQSLEIIEAQCAKLFDGSANGVKVRKYLEGRGFDEATIKRFNLGVAVIGAGSHRELAVGIPYVEEGKIPLVKMRNLATEKSERKFSRTKGGHSGLFNLSGVKDRNQVIFVEGELDAVSLWQLGLTNVVSTSLGAKGDVPQEWKDALAEADDIVLWYDDDEKGDQAVEGLITALGSHRCRVATLDGSAAQGRMCGALKDANDLLRCIVNGVDADEVSAWAHQIVDDAKTIDNAIVVTPDAYADSIASEINKGEESLGVKTGWASMDKLIKGWRTGELTIVTGHTSHGKSTWLVSALDYLASTGEPVLMSAFENGPAGVARKLFQRKLGFPISAINNDDKRARAFDTLARLNEHPVYLLDCYGRTPIATIVDALTYARHRLGIKFAMLDHLHFFLTRPAGVDEREYIDEVTMELVNLTRKLDMHIFLVCHPRGSVDGGTIPTGDSLKGSSSIKQNADNVITVYRAMDMMGDPRPRKMRLKDAQGKRVELELSPNNALLYVSKARHDDALTGSAIFDFQTRNLTFVDPCGPSTRDKVDDVELDDSGADPFSELPF